MDSQNRLLSEEVKQGLVIGWKYYDQTYDQLKETFQIQHKGTISKIINKYKSQDNVDNNHNLSGQIGVINEQSISIVKEILENSQKKYSIQNIQQEYNKQNFTQNLSNSSIYMIIKEVGYRYGKLQVKHKRTDLNKINRKKHCSQYAYQNLDKILFTDESIFSLKDTKVDVWQSDEFDKMIEEKQFQYNNSYIHIWAGVSKLGKTKIHIYENKVNAEQYQICIKECFLLFNDSHKNQIILLQDGARAHTAVSTEQFFREHYIIKIQNPAWSPDLNAIELIWSFMKFQFSKLKANQQIRNKQDLIEEVLNIWDSQVSQNLIDQSIDHVQQQMQYVFEQNGSY